jgi:hypothetical protein
MDVDEFLVPLKGHSVPEILRRFEYAPGVVINWVTFGTNGRMIRERGLVIERFTRHTPFNLYRNRHTKTIVNPRIVARCDVHGHFYLNGRFAVDMEGSEVKKYCVFRQAVHVTLRINHYWTKSVEEFRLKCIRGEVAFTGPRNASEPFARLQKDIDSAPDVVENDSAVEWAIPLVKENMAKRHFDLL